MSLGSAREERKEQLTGDQIKQPNPVVFQTAACHEFMMSFCGHTNVICNYIYICLHQSLVSIYPLVDIYFSILPYVHRK